VSDAAIPGALTAYLDKGVPLSSDGESQLALERPASAELGLDDHWTTGDLGAIVQHQAHEQVLLES
jgi:hypothetical protein